MKIHLNKCPVCDKMPRLSKAMDEYKYFCSVHCSMGNWKHTKNGARRDWNNRTIEQYKG